MSHLHPDNMRGALEASHPDGEAWLAALDIYHRTSSIKAAWGCPKVGHDKNSRELIIGIIAWYDLEYATKRFGKVCATASMRGEKALKGYLRRGGVASKAGYIAQDKAGELVPKWRGRRGSSSTASTKSSSTASTKSSTTTASDPKPVKQYEESAKPPEQLPTDYCAIWREDFLGTPCWRSAAGHIFIDEEGQPGEMVARYNKEGTDWTAVE